MLKRILLFFCSFILIVSCNNNVNRSSKELFINAGETIDPTLSGNDFVYPRHVFETFIIKDKNGNLQGGDCESLDISDDGLTYTFHLRENAKWSDGVNVTANDFVYALQRAANPLSAAEYTSFVEYIKNALKVLSSGEYIDLSKEAYSNNVEMAKKLLADAGYTNGENFPVLEYKNYFRFSLYAGN